MVIGGYSNGQLLNSVEIISQDQKDRHVFIVCGQRPKTCSWCWIFCFLSPYLSIILGLPTYLCLPTYTYLPTYLPTYICLPTYTYLPIYVYLRSSTYLPIYVYLPTYLNILTYLWQPTNIYQPTSTYLPTISTHTYLPTYVFLHIPIYVNLPSPTYLPVPIPNYQYIIDADLGASISLVLLLQLSLVDWSFCHIKIVLATWFTLIKKLFSFENTYP